MAPVKSNVKNAYCKSGGFVKALARAESVISRLHCGRNIVTYT